MGGVAPPKKELKEMLIASHLIRSAAVSRLKLKLCNLLFFSWLIFNFGGVAAARLSVSASPRLRLAFLSLNEASLLITISQI